MLWLVLGAAWGFAWLGYPDWSGGRPEGPSMGDSPSCPCPLCTHCTPHPLHCAPETRLGGPKQPLGKRVHLGSSSEPSVAAKDGKKKKRQQSGPQLCWPASLKPHEIRLCQPAPRTQARAASAGLSGIMIEGPWQGAMEKGASIPSPSHGWEAPAVPTHAVLRHHSEAGLRPSEQAQGSMCLG